MATDYTAVFAALRPVFAKVARRLAVKADTPELFALVTKSPSPFPQHKGHPLEFSAVRVGKAYVSLHLVPIYMCRALNQGISPELKKRMQGKACFNFKTAPGPELLRELKALIEASYRQWSERSWI